jgi:hypothetical protein
MPLLGKQPPSISYFEQQQVVKGPPIPVAKRLESCPTVKSYHPVSLLHVYPAVAIVMACCVASAVDSSCADRSADRAACNLQQRLTSLNPTALVIHHAIACIWHLAEGSRPRVATNARHAAQTGT